MATNKWLVLYAVLNDTPWMCNICGCGSPVSAPFELWMNPSARMDLLDLVPELVVSCAVHIKHLGAEMT